MADEIGQHLEPQRQAPLQAAHLEAGPLLPRRGVDVTALPFDRFDDLAGRAGTGALEHHVLQHVGPAGRSLALPARAPVDDDG